MLPHRMKKVGKKKIGKKKTIFQYPTFNLIVAKEGLP